MHELTTAAPLTLEFTYRQYARAKHTPNHPAWRHFIEDTVRLFRDATEAGWIFSTSLKDSYSGAQSMFSDMDRTHLTIYTGDQNPLADHPLNGVVPAELGTFTLMEAARAVHDIYGHWVSKSGFDIIGETLAWQASRLYYSPQAWPALDAEIMGQTAFFFTTGEYPAIQEAKVICLTK